MSRRNQPHFVFFTSMLACITVFNGCRSGQETVEVTGVVTLDGQTVSEAAVMFSGPNGGSPATARTDADGQFTVRVVPGLSNVAVSKSQVTGDGTVGEDGTMPAGRIETVTKSLVPDKYADLRNSGLTVEVARGMDTVKLRLSSN